jgi:isopentenyl phosphate kinase
MLKIERAISSPKDLAHIVFKAAESEIDDVIKENEKRAERLKRPLPMPRWNVKEMLENLVNLTEKTFTPHFQRYASEHPWDGKSSREDWEKVATEMLRDYYLLPLSHDDADLFQQMCEIWSDLIPEPTLTKKQKAELVKLQKQADNIIARAEKLIEEFMELVEKEKEIVIGTQSNRDMRIAKQVQYIKGNLFHYHDKHVAKW